MTMSSNDLWATALKTLCEKDRNSVVFDGQQKLDVLSSLRQLVASAKEDSVRKRWQFRRPGDGQTVILRDLFSKIVVWMDRFKEIGDIVVQYDPTHAALPWACVRFVLEVAVSDIKRFAFVVEGVETVTRSISRYAMFEQIYIDHGRKATGAVNSLEEALVRLYATILVYLGKAKRYFEGHTPKHIAKAVIKPPSDFEVLLHNIDHELANVDRQARLVDAERKVPLARVWLSLPDQRKAYAKLHELLRSIDSPICRMSRQLDSLEDQLDRNIICARVGLMLTSIPVDLNRVKVLEWLSSQPYMDHHRQIMKQALAGSGQWLLQDPLYTQWYKQSVSSLLWLHGKPGSGKSTLISLVIQDMLNRFEAGQNDRPIYFYCTRSAAEPERSNAHAVLSSLLRQLSCARPGAPILPPVIEKYEQQGEGFKSNGLDADDSRDLIVKLVEDYSMTTIIVDALDECDLLMRQSLLDAFEHILKESRGLVKIFVSSRNDQDIVCTLRSYPNMDISSDKNAADIGNYVKTETMKLVEKGLLLRNSRAKEEITATIIDKVSSGADGMFRWASLQLDALRALKHDEDIRARLGKLPPKLAELYVEVYNNLISAQGCTGRSIIDKALKWLLCAKKELHSSEFLIAVAASLDSSGGAIDQDNLLDLCNNFVVYDEVRDVFRFAHLSVREFLEKKPEFTEVSCYSLAAESCLLQVIASSNCGNTERLMSEAHLLRLRSCPPFEKHSSCASFLDYANRFWIPYCQSIPVSDRLEDSELGRIFWFFFSDNLGSASPLNAWVQWHCSRVLSQSDSAALLELQRFLTGCSDILSKSLLVASYYGFSEIVTFCLKQSGLGDEKKDRGLLLAAMAGQWEVFAILVDREDWAMTEPLLNYAVRAIETKRLAWLLDSVPDTMISGRVFAAIVEDQDDGKTTILLDRYPGLKITERMLEVAVESASPDNYILLVARAAKPAITERMLHWTNVTSQPNAILREKLLILLDRTGQPFLTPSLVASALWCEDELIKEEILKRCGASNITEEVMISAAQRHDGSFHSVLEYGGKVTDKFLDQMASRGDVRAWHELLEQGYEISVNAERLRRAALRLHDNAVLNFFLEHEDNRIPDSEMFGLICAVARKGQNEPIKRLLDRAKDIRISQEMLLAATMNSNPNRLDRVKMFLDRASKFQITEDMLVVAVSDSSFGWDLVRIFVERKGDTEISQYVLMAAACNFSQVSKIMPFLLEQTTVADLTTDVLICAARNLNPDLVLELLERSQAKVGFGCLLEAAAANPYYGDHLVMLLLARAKNIELQEAILIEAVDNQTVGRRVIDVLEKAFGQVNISEGLMAKFVHRATPATMMFLLSRVDSMDITQDMLLQALRIQTWNSNLSQRTIVEKSFHIPITTEILLHAAQYAIPNVFRFLWNRSHMSSVSEDLINAAAKCSESSTFEWLLNKADSVEVGEETLIVLAANRLYGCAYFDLLLEQGLQADTTEGVPNNLLMNGGIKVKCFFLTPIKLRKGTKVTEKMFRVAASCGNERFLEILAKSCNMDRIPEKWLDIARLYTAASKWWWDTEYWASHNVIQTLLESGVEHDVASPDGQTPLAAAVTSGNEPAVQILLSAGALPDGGPNITRSPLCQAALCGDYDVAKLLVNAGASLDLKDENGRTPAMIAQAKGHILIYKYLMECKKEKESRQLETTNLE